MMGTPVRNVAAFTKTIVKFCMEDLWKGEEDRKRINKMRYLCYFLSLETRRQLSLDLFTRPAEEEMFGKSDELFLIPLPLARRPCPYRSSRSFRARLCYKRSVVLAMAEKVSAFGVRVHAVIYPRLSAPRFLVSKSVDLAAKNEVDQPN